MCSFLQELNDAVGVKFIDESPENLIEKFFTEFASVIANRYAIKIQFIVNT